MTLFLLNDASTELFNNLFTESLSKEGKWVEMGNLVDDEILGAFAVVGEPEQIAEELKQRFGDIVQRLSFYAPYRSDAERWRKVFEDLKAA